MIIASSWAIAWVTDNVIVPRFEQGSVAWSTVAAGCLLIVAIGELDSEPANTSFKKEPPA